MNALYTTKRPLQEGVNNNSVLHEHRDTMSHARCGAGLAAV
jgi:hypothetical protein